MGKALEESGDHGRVELCRVAEEVVGELGSARFNLEMKAPLLIDRLEHAAIAPWRANR